MTKEMWNGIIFISSMLSFLILCPLFAYIGFVVDEKKEKRRNKMKQYVKEPIPVYAVKVEKENYEEIIELLKMGVTAWEEFDYGFMVYSWEGVEPVKYGSNYYIIRGIKGECYPCDGKVFEESYEEIK